MFQFQIDSITSYYKTVKTHIINTKPCIMENSVTIQSNREYKNDINTKKIIHQNVGMEHSLGTRITLRQPKYNPDHTMAEALTANRQI